MNGKVMALFFVAALTAVMVTTGCKSVTRTRADGSTVTNSIPDPLVLETVSQEAASIGTTSWLIGHPQDREDFELSRKAIKGLLAVGSGSVQDLQAALSLLPVEELQGTNGAVAVQAASVMIKTAGAYALRLDTKDVWSDYVQPIAQGLAQGLDAALGAETP